MSVLPSIIKEIQGSWKSPKTIFSDLETYSIESGVVDLVGWYQVGVQTHEFWTIFAIFCILKGLEWCLACLDRFRQA